MCPEKSLNKRALPVANISLQTAYREKMLNVILLLHENVRKTYESKEPIKKKKKKKCRKVKQHRREKKNTGRGKWRHLLLGNDTDNVASGTSSNVTIIK